MSQDLNQVPTYGGFDGHESEISGPFADPSTGPSTNPTRPQLSAGGGRSRPPRTPSEAPPTLPATDAPAAGAGGGKAAAMSPATEHPTGAAEGKTAQGAASTPAAAPKDESGSSKGQKGVGKGVSPQPKSKGEAVKKGSEGKTEGTRKGSEAKTEGTQKGSEAKTEGTQKGSQTKAGGVTSGTSAGKTDSGPKSPAAKSGPGGGKTPKPPPPPPPLESGPVAGEGTGERAASHAGGSLTVTAVLPATTAQHPVAAAQGGNFTILLDKREEANTYLSAQLFIVGLAVEVMSPSGRPLVRLQFGPDRADCLWLPRTGLAIGTGTTSRVAIQDALTFDGMGFRSRNERPETWLIQNTKGLYVEPRRATLADVNPGEIWEGLGAVDLQNIPENRGRINWTRSLYRSPHLDFREWNFRDFQDGHRPVPEWCPATTARLQRAGIESVQHLRRLRATGFWREVEHMTVIDPDTMPERRGLDPASQDGSGPGSGPDFGHGHPPRGGSSGRVKSSRGHPKNYQKGRGKPGGQPNYGRGRGRDSYQSSDGRGTWQTSHGQEELEPEEGGVGAPPSNGSDSDSQYMDMEQAPTEGDSVAPRGSDQYTEPGEAPISCDPVTPSNDDPMVDHADDKGNVEGVIERTPELTPPPADPTGVVAPGAAGGGAARVPSATVHLTEPAVAVPAPRIDFSYQQQTLAKTALLASAEKAREPPLVRPADLEEAPPGEPDVVGPASQPLGGAALVRPTDLEEARRNRFVWTYRITAPGGSCPPRPSWDDERRKTSTSPWSGR